MQVQRSITFSAEQIDQLRALADRAQAADGSPTFADDLWHQATSGRTTVVVTATTDVDVRPSDGPPGDVRPGDRHPAPAPSPKGTLVGTAFAAPQGDRLAAELVVDPVARRQGHGGALLAELIDAVDGELWLWSHGDHPAARALAARHHLVRARELLQLRRPASAPVPDVPAPPGVTVRTFVPGRDEHAWLDVNAAAFSWHPEQGSRTLEDLRAAEAEPWFDPAGFFLAVDAGGDVVGFHWTKIHAPADIGPDAAPVGEVYVLGVAPHAHGRGIGAYLTAVGLRHLAGQPGVREVKLYVEGDNEAALKVYGRLGFTRYATDVAYRRPPASPGLQPA